MKTIKFLIILQALFLLTAKSQTIRDDSIIIEKVIKEVSPNSIVQILDSVNKKKEVPQRLQKAILQGKFYSDENSIFNFETGEIIIDKSKLIFSLTEVEKKYLIEEIAKTTIWNNENLKNKIIVSESDERKICRLTITKPIYIRKNTICFVAWGGFGEYCGRTGQEFYIRKGKDWVKLYVVSSGNF